MNKNKAEIITVVIVCLIIFCFWYFVIRELYGFKTDYECSRLNNREFFMTKKCKPYWSYRQVGKK